MDPPRKTPRTGRRVLFILLFGFVLVFLCLAFSRISLPWRVLRPLAADGARWTLTARSLRVEPVQWSGNGVSLSAPAAIAAIDWVRLAASGDPGGVSLPGGRLEIENLPASPEAYDFSLWRAVLGAGGLPVGQFAMPDLTLAPTSGGPTFSGSFSGIRNPAGALEASGFLRDERLSLEFFLRLGRDSLESGGTFSGTLRPETPPQESLFSFEPFRSLLAPFGDIRFEGSFFLDELWRFRDGVRMVEAVEESASMGGATVRELAFSGATVFAAPEIREDRAILEGLSSGDGGLFRIEADRRNDGPVRVSLFRDGAPVLRIDADRWREGSPARVRAGDGKATARGLLREDAGGAMSFVPDPETAVPLPGFRIPGFFSVDGSVRLPPGEAAPRS
ncbi:MAG: hypothetical protein ACLFRP_04350 [Puniceicoccaceae bacterium]